MSDPASMLRWIALSAFLVPCATKASPCLYVGFDDSARVINRTGEMTAPFPEPLVALDCTRLRVAHGAVRVYGLSDSVEARSAREVREGGGALSGAANAAVVGGERSGGLLRQIMTVLQGNQRARLGSSRSGDEEHVVAAMPSGRLGEPTSDLVIALGLRDDARFEKLELRQGGKLVHQQRGPARELRLPVQHLKAGRRVEWQLRYAGQGHRGEFAIESAQSLTALKERLASAAGGGSGGSGDTAAQLDLAAGLTREGFAWDARELVRAALKPQLDAAPR